MQRLAHPDPAVQHGEVLIFPTPAEALARLGQMLVDAGQAAVSARGAFTLVVSGGSLPSQMGSIPADVLAQVPWDRTHVFYVDERNVPYSSPDSTHKIVQEHLLSRVAIPPGNEHAIAEGMDVGAAARDYDRMLHELAAGACG